MSLLCAGSSVGADRTRPGRVEKRGLVPVEFDVGNSGEDLGHLGRSDRVFFPLPAGNDGDELVPDQGRAQAGRDPLRDDAVGERRAWVGGRAPVEDFALACGTRRPAGTASITTSPRLVSTSRTVAAANPTMRSWLMATHARIDASVSTARTASPWWIRQSAPCGRAQISVPSTCSMDANTGAHARSDKATTGSSSPAPYDRIRQLMPVSLAQRRTANALPALARNRPAAGPGRGGRRCQLALAK